jgi:WD40 repeat protein
MSLGAFPYEQAFSVGVSYDLCFAPDESALFVVARRLQRWDTVTGRRTHSVAWSNGSGIDVSPDGRRVVAMNTSGDAIMLDAASMEQLWVVRGRGVGEGTAPVFSPDGSAFVTGSRGGDLVVRDAETGDVVLHERAAWITGIACSPNRKLFGISRYAEHESAIELRCWPFSDHDGRQLLVGAPVGEVALDAAGRIAASTRSGVAIYHASNGSLLRRGAAEHSSVGGLAWAPDGELVAVDRFDNTVLGMDDQTLTPTWTLELPYACAAAYSRSGALLALGSWERGIVASRTGAVTTAGDPTPIDDDHTSAGTQPRNDEEQWIIGYIETEANESVIRLDKVASKQGGTIHHDVWDVRCESSRWWAITEPLAAYDQEDHPDRDAALVPRPRVGLIRRRPPPRRRRHLNATRTLGVRLRSPARWNGTLRG